MKTPRAIFAFLPLLPIAISQVPAAEASAPVAAPAATSSIFADTTAKLVNLLAFKHNNAIHNLPSGLTPEQVQTRLASPEMQQLRQMLEHYDDNQQSLVSALVAQDVKVALAWAQNSPDVPETDRFHLVDVIVRTWAITDPIAAAAFARSFESKNFSEVSSVAEVWAKSDSVAALNFAESLPEGVTRIQAIGSVLATLARVNAPEAWKQASRHNGDERYHTLYGSIIGSWSEKDPAAAAQALASLPYGTFGALSNNVADLLMTNWFNQDPVAATAWVASLPPGPLRTAAEISLNQWQQAKAHGGALVATGGTIFTADGAVIHKNTGSTPSSGSGPAPPSTPLIQLKPITVNADGYPSVGTP